MKYHNSKAAPGSEEVYVFASNLGGSCTKGQAKKALKYGSEKGHASGRMGKAFAIAVRDSKLELLPLETVLANIASFLEYCQANSETMFFVEKVGTTKDEFSPAIICKAFAGAGENCSLPEEWAILMPVVDQTPDVSAPLETCASCTHRQFRSLRPASRFVLGNCAHQSNSSWLGETHICQIERYEKRGNDQADPVPTELAIDVMARMVRAPILPTHSKPASAVRPFQERSVQKANPLSFFA
jgi:hypothetical protein